MTWSYLEYILPGAHEGRRPEGASNGGSKCSAGCKYYALADITLLRFDVRACICAYVRIHAARATGTIESERYRDRDVKLYP